jgi:hypothetical protein
MKKLTLLILLGIGALSVANVGVAQATQPASKPAVVTGNAAATDKKAPDNKKKKKHKKKDANTAEAPPAK